VERVEKEMKMDEAMQELIATKIYRRTFFFIPDAQSSSRNAKTQVLVSTECRIFRAK